MAFIDWKYTVNFWKGKLGLRKTSPSKVLPAKNIEITKPIENTSGSSWDAFDPEFIMSDEEFLDADSMSENQIQEFLVSKGGVILPDYKIDSHLVSYWMAKHCQEQGLNPKVLMTHMQKEMGAVTRKTPYKKQRTYDYILGVGATDGGDKEKWAGMDRQLLGAAQTCVKWHKRGTKENTYPMTNYNASDRKGLKIRNSATFSLYKYTPWVGDEDKQIGKNLYKSPFGNYLFWKVYRGFFNK